MADDLYNVFNMVKLKDDAGKMTKPSDINGGHEMASSEFQLGCWISSESVIKAYISRCKEVNPLINAIVEDRFDLALEEAREMDNFLKATTDSEEEIEYKYPLFGLPITIKESVAVRGMSYAVGVVKDKSIKAAEDAIVVTKIKKAGGIPLLVSNTPELCLAWEAYNYITGTTWNPYDTRRIAGGSSGGEGALVGCGASVLSVSSDIGGSVRLPAMFCGVFGHKPSPESISSVGHKPISMEKIWDSIFSICPMVRYAIDLPLFLKVMVQDTERTKNLNKKIALNSIKMFYMEDDGGSGITNSVDEEIVLSIRRLVDYMEITHGITVQKANLKNMKFGFELMANLLTQLDDVNSIFENRDERSIFFEMMKYIFCLSPYTLPPLIYEALRKTRYILPKCHYRYLEEKKYLLKKEFEDLLSNDGVFIYPTFVSAAIRPREIFRLCNVSYMGIFNILGLPVTQCPMGLNKDGLPIGLQIVANDGCDHLTIAVAQEIEKAFGGWQQHFNNSKRT